MIKRTSGPWITDVINGITWRASVRTSEGSLIAACAARDSDDEAKANARLIAAAPELLDCCSKALAAWEGTGPAILLDDLRAAIAKAVQS